MDVALRGEGGAIDVSADADAPLPLLGIQGAFRFKPRWRLAGTFEVFALSTDDASGNFRDHFIALEYDVGDRIGIGFGFNRADLEVSIVEPKFRGAVTENFDASFFYVTGRIGARQSSARSASP